MTIIVPSLRATVEALLSRARSRGVVPGDAGGHAGELETSLMLALAPNLVKVDMLEPGYTGPLDGGAVAVFFGKGVHALSANGVPGRPACCIGGGWPGLSRRVSGRDSRSHRAGGANSRPSVKSTLIGGHHGRPRLPDLGAAAPPETGSVGRGGGSCRASCKPCRAAGRRLPPASGQGSVVTHAGAALPTS